MIDSHRRRRPLRVLAYVLLGMGAGVLMADPTQSIQATDQDLRKYWSALLLFGTVLCVYGAWTDKYLSEFIGLMPLITAFAAFVVALGAKHTTGTVAFGCFLGALVVIMFSRWLDLWKLTGISTRAERKRR